jgi:TetR/AcrR family transcriptional regulator of autoinduction and epiphytic fitness
MPSEKSTQRSDAIVAAACRAFLAHGYEGASMDMVAAEAGVTKKTVYNHFAGKEALFEAVVECFCDEVGSGLQSAGERPHNIEEGLLRFCRKLIATMAVAPGLEIYRLAITMSPRFPQFGQSLHMAGTARIVSALAEYLDHHVARGELSITDTPQAARQLLGAITFLIQTALLGAEIHPGSADAERYISDAVRTFVRGHAPGSTR